MAIAKSAIKSSANSLLVKCKLCAFPVNLEVIANHLGIRIIFEDMEDNVSGLLVIKSGKRAIGVNKRHHSNRQRFTIAHELGHFVLHHKSFEDPKNDLHWDKKWAYFRSTDSSGVSSDEFEANQFAAELLMPEGLLKSLIRSEQIDLNNDIDIAKLAELIQVSEKALTIRLIALKLVQPY